jgi:two-component system chemotaxis response regulator CheB
VINAERIPRDVVTIGASAGGVEALVGLFARLPRTLPAAIAVVLHRSPAFESQLAAVLGRRSPIPVLEPVGPEPFEMGRIYVAPRDRHLVLEGRTLRPTRGPKQHWTRPAIDPLFRSAASTYGPRVVGVLLSGFGADGASGLVEIKRAGGISLVQDPAEARQSAMPRNAIAGDDVDGVLALEEIAAGLVALSAGKAFDEVRVGDRAAS